VIFDTLSPNSGVAKLLSDVTKACKFSRFLRSVVESCWSLGILFRFSILSATVTIATSFRTSHNWPIKLLIHEQLKTFSLTEHMPPFWQGDGIQVTVGITKYK